MANNDKNNRDSIKRVSWFDGINPESKDFQTEQDGMLQHINYVVSDFVGSGVLQKNSVTMPPILDTSNPNPANISLSDLNAGAFDGKGIFVDRQPIDFTYGNQLLISVENVKIPLYNKLKIIIFGKVYDSNVSQGTPVLEIITFDKPGQQATLNYFKSVIAVFFNNFSGGSGRTALSASAQNSLNTFLPGQSGKIIIQEAGPLQVLDHSVILKQNFEPNLDVRDFVTSTVTRNFNDELTVVVTNAQNTNYVPVSLLDLNQLPLNTNGIFARPYLDATTSGVIYGQKIFVETDNIQQLSFALSLENDAYGWSGEFVIGIRPLQTKSVNQFANKIDLDPDVNVLFEASFTQNDLLQSGYILSTIPQEIKFNFIGTALAKSKGIIVPNTYYIITITRRADISTGKVFIEAGNQDAVNTKFSAYNPTNKTWTDDATINLWFKVYSAAIRVSAGIAYTANGKMVSLPKIATASDSSIVSVIAGPYSLVSIDAIASDNIVVLNSTEAFQEPTEHPRTGNLVYLRVIDKVTITILSKDAFNELLNTEQNTPIVLAVINDFNNAQNSSFAGVITFPGQVRKNQIILINSGVEDKLLNVNTVIVPNTSTSGVKYRIVEAKSTTQYLGDFNNDKIFTSDDLLHQIEVQDVFSAQSTNISQGTSFNPYSIFDTRSRDALGFGAETIEDFILSDMNNDFIINSSDIERLQYLTTTLPSFVSPAPTSVTLQVLTVENITNVDAQILVAQISNINGYATSNVPDEISFTALNVGDMRALSTQDRVFLSSDGITNVDGSFANLSYPEFFIKKFVQRNDFILETRFASNVIPTIDTSYVLSFYDQNPVFNGRLGVFGEIATEVLEFVVPGIDLIAAGILLGDKVVISSDTLAQSRVGTYTISQIIDAVTFRVISPINPIPAGIATAGIEFFASDGITVKLQDIAVVEFNLNTVNLISSNILPGDKLHVTLGPSDVNGVYTVARVLSATTLTINPPLSLLTADAKTTLTNTVNSGAVTLFVANTDAFPTNGTLLLDSDQITYTGKTSISFTGVSGVTMTHNANAIIYQTFAATFQINDSTDVLTKIAPTALTGVHLDNGPVFPEIETLAPVSLPNGIDSVFKFSLTHVPTTGTVDVHWITAGVTNTMTFDASPVQIVGAGSPENSSIDRLTGTIVLDTFIPPDADTAITIDYRVAPIITLKHCYPTVINAVSPTQTDIEFRVPFINPIPSIDLSGIRLCPYVIVQTDNADPPDIVLDGSNNVVAGAVTPNTINAVSDGYTLPHRNVVLQLIDANNNPASIAAGQYWMQIYSGARVNVPATQKEFLSDSLNISSPIVWEIEKNNFEWAPVNMVIRDYRRFLPVSFVASETKSEKYRSANEIWMPADLFIGHGEIFSSPGVPYHGDLEITKINIDLPVTALLSNSISVYDTIIASYAPTPGITRGGRVAMKFSDGTYVGFDDVGLETALTKNQVRVVPSLSSLYIDGYQVPNASSYTDLDEVLTKLHYQVRMGMHYDDNAGILYFHAQNIKAIFEEEPIVQTGILRVVLDIALKKSGFINPVVSINSMDVLRLFNNPVEIIPQPQYSIAGEIVAGFVVGRS